LVIIDEKLYFFHFLFIQLIAIKKILDFKYIFINKTYICTKQTFFVHFLNICKKYPYIRDKISMFMEKSKLIKIRKNLGLSCKEIADLLCIEEYSYRRRENGKTKISNQEWKKLASILSVPFEAIFEPESISFDNSKNTTPEISTNHYYNIPKEMVDNQQEYINILKIEIASLKKENLQLKEKLLAEKEKKYYI
jgi:transcriptional regulator with XRE-family HTH domain